jgi:hypothetical protein
MTFCESKEVEETKAAKQKTIENAVWTISCKISSY